MSDECFSETSEVTGRSRKETTGQRATQLRRSGVRMCGPVPPTDGDLDVVEEFLRFLRNRKAQ